MVLARGHYHQRGLPGCRLAHRLPAGRPSSPLGMAMKSDRGRPPGWAGGIVAGLGPPDDAAAVFWW